MRLASNTPRHRKPDDTMVKLVLTGRIPSKKNNRMKITVRGNSFMIPNKEYKAWHADASIQLMAQKARPVQTPCTLELHFYYPDNRKTDNTNKAESVHDLLVDNKIIEDDSWQHAPVTIQRSMGVDKLNPRVEILLY